MGAQSGANLTGATMSSQSCELETSSITDHDATTTPPPMGGGSQTGAQESPSTSDVELEYCEKYNMIFPIFIERQMRPQYIYSVARSLMHAQISNPPVAS